MKKILLIEDEKILRDMYVQKISESGMKVVWADNSKEGLEIAKKEAPDLVILDILLPGKSGLYFLENLKKDSLTSQLKVVVFSNYDDLDAKKKALALGAKAYLIKTQFTPKEMLKKIKEYLD